MKLERVTITGIDDKVSHDDIIKISQQYPLVEWGILFSPSRTGQQRYPTLEWVKELKAKVEVFKAPPTRIKFSAHLCGDYTKELIEKGDNPLIQRNADFQNVGDLFKRVQLNFNASKNIVREGFYDFIKRHGGKPDKVDFIIQYNKANNHVCQEIIKRKIPVHFLWDSSGGRGTLISYIENSIKDYFTGYSGGFNPENLPEVLEKMQDANLPDTKVWTDVESGVRTNNEFDIAKVVKFLEIASNTPEQ